jgi:Cu+-exporting ATPase
MSDDTLIDYSFVTGESVPVAQKQGDRVYAGGRLNGPIAEMEVIRPMEQSYLTRLWNNPVFKRSTHTDQTVYVESINRWFTAITLILAFGALGYWMPQDATKAMNAFTAVLIIACPCALLLAATFTHGNMLRILGLNGFYLRSAQVIERLAESRGIIFDKTGTITNSQRTHLEWIGTEISDDQKSAVYSLVVQSAHPYSRLISRLWGSDQRKLLTQFQEIAGSGLKGMIDNHWVLVGNRAFVDAKREADSVEGSVWVRIDDQILGYFTVKQEYRSGLEQFVRNLSKTFRLALLSGDNNKEAVQLRTIFGESVSMLFEQSPENKMAEVKKLQDSGMKWIMVGDGLNDAGALAQSHAGIAVTDDLNRFSPACDAILDGKKLTSLDTFIEYARKGKGIVNLAFGVSLIYNVIGLSYALSGNLSPVIAAVLMPIMSISIVVLSTLTGTWLARRSGLIISTTKMEGAPL